jgi:hypothetical protein
MKIFFDFRFLSKQNKNKGFWILVYFGWLLGEDKCLSPIRAYGVKKYASLRIGHSYLKY